MNKENHKKTQVKKTSKADKDNANGNKSPGKNMAVLEREFRFMLEGILPKLLKDYGYPPLPHKFEVIRARKADDPQIIEIKNNTAEIVNIDYIAGRIVEYVELLTGKQKRYNIQNHVAKQFAVSWANVYTHRTETPKAVGFLSDKDLCMHRLDFDPIDIDRSQLESKAPIFADYLTRMTNADAFCARVGSIFDPKAHRKQAVWLRGAKDSGKSGLIEIIGLLVGGFENENGSAVILSQENLDDKYWKQLLVGKRIMMVEEAESKFIRSQAFKALTGSKIHTIRPFQGKPYQAVLEPLLFFASNYDVQIPNDESFFERIILCNIEKIPLEKRKGLYDVLDDSQKELPYIAGYCMSKWKEVKPGFDIPCETKELKAMSDDFEGKYLDFIENYLDFSDMPVRIPDIEYCAQLNHIQKLMIYEDIKSNQEQAICRRLILSKKNVTLCRPLINGKRPRCLVGVKIRSEHRDLLLKLLGKTTYRF
jgi:hypothetical protein